MAEKFYWGEDNCELARQVKYFVEENDGKPELPSQNPNLRSIEKYFKKCLFDRDYDGLDKLARIFNRAVLDRPEFSVMYQVGYAYGEARILSGMKFPLKRHVREAYKRRRPDLSIDAMDDNMERFEERGKVEFGVEPDKKKGGRPKRGSGLYEVANKRLKEINPHSTDPESGLTRWLLTDLLRLFGKYGE